jgi:hypothetical protein
MKFHSPQFERGLKRLVKQTIRSSPELKREHRRVRRFRKNINTAWLWRLAIPCLLGYAVCSIQSATGHLATALAGCGIYLLAALCFRISGLWTKLYNSTDQFVLMQLPLPTAIIFRWQMQKFFRESLSLGVDLLAMLGTLAWINNFSLWQWLGVPVFVALAWLNILGLAIVCVLWLPRAPFQIISAGLVVLGLVLFFGRSGIGPLALRLLDGCALVINQLLPTAWAVAPFELLIQPRRWWLLLTWLPVAFVIGMLKPCHSRLRDRMVYREALIPEASDQVPGDEDETRPPTESPRQLGLSEIENIVATGSFLVQPGHPLRQFPEQKLWAWLNPRERALAGFLHPAGMNIGAAWKRIYTIMLVTFLLSGVLGFVSPMFQLTTLGLGAFVVFCMMLATFVNHGRGFAPTLCSGVNVPMYAHYGIGFKELTGFFLKHSTIQMPFLIGAFVIMGGFAAWFLKLPATMGLVGGFKAGGLIFAGRFILMVFAFSSGSNDSSRFRISSIMLIFGVVLLALMFLFLGGASLFVPDAVPAFCLWLGALFDAWLFFWGYGWFYRLSRFDLMSIPRQ